MHILLTAPFPVAQADALAVAQNLMTAAGLKVAVNNPLWSPAEGAWIIYQNDKPIGRVKP